MCAYCPKQRRTMMNEYLVDTSQDTKNLICVSKEVNNYYKIPMKKRLRDHQNHQRILYASIHMYAH